MKRTISAMVTVVMVITMLAFPVSAAESAVNVTVDGVTVAWTDAAPYVDENNRTMVPLRAVAEALDIEVEWNQSENAAIFYKEYSEKDHQYYSLMEAGNYLLWSQVTFYINSSTYLPEKGGQTVAGDPWASYSQELPTMDTVPVVINGRTYAPIRYLAEAFGYTVDWDSKTNSVLVVSEQKVEDDISEYTGTIEDGMYYTQITGSGSLELMNTSSKTLLIWGKVINEGTLEYAVYDASGYAADSNINRDTIQISVEAGDTAIISSGEENTIVQIRMEEASVESMQITNSDFPAMYRFALSSSESVRLTNISSKDRNKVSIRKDTSYGDVKIQSYFYDRNSGKKDNENISSTLQWSWDEKSELVIMLNDSSQYAEFYFPYKMLGFEIELL